MENNDSVYSHIITMCDIHAVISTNVMVLQTVGYSFHLFFTDNLMILYFILVRPNLGCASTA
jgi:hypothetical protein